MKANTVAPYLLPPRLVFPREKVGAFTMTELLVVILITSVLAALLIPVGQKVMAAGKTTQCSNNLRQIGLAIHSYAQDYDGRIISFIYANNASWWQVLAPYLGARDIGLPLPGDKKRSVYMCPVAKPNNSGLTEYAPSSAYLTRYNVNPHIAAFETAIAAGGASATYRFSRMSQMAAPSKTYICADVFGNGGGGFWMVSNGSLTYPHQGGMNVLFLDNHVERMTRDRMSYLGAHPYHIFWRGYDWGYPGYETE